MPEYEPNEVRTGYYVGIHPYCFRGSEPARIMGTIVDDPDNNGKPRLCFVLKFRDGVTDTAPLYDASVYKIVSDPEGGRF